MARVPTPAPPTGAMANTYAGKCGCGAWVAAGFGTTERQGQRWVTSCTTCKPVQRQGPPAPAKVPDPQAPHVCWGARKRVVHDARGIYAFTCCPICEQEKRARYRPEVFTDPAYICDEPVEVE